MHCWPILLASRITKRCTLWHTGVCRWMYYLPISVGICLEIFSSLADHKMAAFLSAGKQNSLEKNMWLWWIRNLSSFMHFQIARKYLETIFIQQGIINSWVLEWILLVLHFFRYCDPMAGDTCVIIATHFKVFKYLKLNRPNHSFL